MPTPSKYPTSGCERLSVLTSEITCCKHLRKMNSDGSTLKKKVCVAFLLHLISYLGGGEREGRAWSSSSELSNVSAIKLEKESTMCVVDVFQDLSKTETQNWIQDNSTLNWLFFIFLEQNNSPSAFQIRRRRTE